MATSVFCSVIFRSTCSQLILQRHIFKTVLGRDCRFCVKLANL